MSQYLTATNFRAFDPDRGTKIHVRNLPHWDQEGVCAFVTFRLKDSLPAAVREDFARQKRQWLRQNGWPDTLQEAEILERLSPLEKSRFNRFASSRFHRILDQGRGDCVLRESAIRHILINTLHYASGNRYFLGDFVIMPNHVHLLMQPCKGERLKSCLGSIRHYSAREINKQLARKGDLWQAEPYDHLVRSYSYYLKYRKYIHLNPHNARLKSSDYTLWGP